MNVPREVTAAEIAQLLRDVDAAARRLGYDGRGSVLDVPDIARRTGIGPARVQELLDGAEPEPPPRENKAREAFYRRLVSRRLDMLRRSNPDSPDGESYREIGDEVDLSHSLIGHLVNGKRSARPEYSSPLETRYGVAHGFLSRPEGDALTEHLVRVKEGLHAGAVLEGLRVLGGEQVSLRRTDDDTPSLEGLVAVVDALVARKRILDRADRAEPEGPGGDSGV
ncbi:hypothetical protein ACFXP3_17360 [Streptomyces sp. NPDC059096]|uniref:hypothetical protein n=1 Tax=unclassified Streptomyces TaxID=2593676 RepID=UPI00369FB574